MTKHTPLIIRLYQLPTSRKKEKKKNECTALDNIISKY